jgi:hypothetical protein
MIGLPLIILSIALFLAHQIKNDIKCDFTNFVLFEAGFILAVLGGYLIGK